MILAFVASVVIGAAVSLPLFSAGRRLDPSRLERMERFASFLLSPLLLTAFWVISQLYAPAYLRVLGAVAGLPLLVSLLVLLRRDENHWRRFPQIAAGLTLFAVTASEATLKSAETGGPPSRFPALVAQLGGPRAIPALSTSLRDGDTPLRLQAAEELEKFGPKSAAILGTAISDRDPAVRHLAATVACKSPLPEQKAAWCALLRDPHPGDRSAARSALRMLKDPSTVPAILTALSEATDVNERNEYTELLRGLGRTNLAVMEELVQSDEPNLRLTVIESLGKIGTGPAALLLLRLAETDRDARVRAGALAAVAEAAADNRKDEAFTAASLEHGGALFTSALGYVDCSRVLKTLVAATHDRDAIVRAAAVAGIGGISLATDSTLNGHKVDLKDPDNGLMPLDLRAAQATVIQRLSDPDEKVRSLAAGALGENMDPSNVPALIQALARAPQERPDRGMSSVAVSAVVYNRAHNPVQYLCKALIAAGDRRAIPALAARDATYRPVGYCDLCEALYRLGAPERVRHPVLIVRERE